MCRSSRCRPSGGVQWGIQCPCPPPHRIHHHIRASTIARAATATTSAVAAAPTAPAFNAAFTAAAIPAAVSAAAVVIIAVPGTTVTAAACTGIWPDSI